MIRFRPGCKFVRGEPAQARVQPDNGVRRIELCSLGGALQTCQPDAPFKMPMICSSENLDRFIACLLRQGAGQSNLKVGKTQWSRSHGKLIVVPNKWAARYRLM